MARRVVKPKVTKEAPPPPEVLASDRDVLTRAYKTGLIVAWRRDTERGYRLTFDDRRDEYVELAKLTGYLERLRKDPPAVGRAPAVRRGAADVRDAAG